MVSLTTPKAEIGEKAPSFSLPGTDGKIWSLDNCRGEKGLLVMFICNHCPYVIAILDRIVRDSNELLGFGINSVAIMPNDTVSYPMDSFENMRVLSEKKEFSFPYLYDESQDIAKNYGAVCTPDFFGYDEDLVLRYRGRLDASRKETAPENSERELFEAMKIIASHKKGPENQMASMGCSIKWKEEK